MQRPGWRGTDDRVMPAVFPANMYRGLSSSRTVEESSAHGSVPSPPSYSQEHGLSWCCDPLLRQQQAQQLAMANDRPPNLIGAKCAGSRCSEKVPIPGLPHASLTGSSETHGDRISEPPMRVQPQHAVSPRQYSDCAQLGERHVHFAQAAVTSASMQPPEAAGVDTHWLEPSHHLHQNGSVLHMHQFPSRDRAARQEVSRHCEQALNSKYERKP